MRRVTGLVTALSVALLVLPAPVTASERASMAGRVRDAAGEPLGAAAVTAVPEDCAGGAEPCPEPRTATTDGGGDWELTGLPAGAYALHAADPSGEHADQWWDGRVEPRDTVVLEEGEHRADLDFDLEEAAVIAGRVRDAGGDPLAGATARAARTPFSVAEATTDADGRFALRGLAARTYEVEVAAPDAGLGEVVETVALGAGEVAELDVALPLLGLRVVRVAGPDRVATAVAASREAFAEAGTVVLASAGSFPDALAAAPLAASLEAPLLLVGRSLPESVAEEVDRLGAGEAVIVGAVGAVPLLVGEQLRRLGVAVRRVPGETRFDTAALLAREVAAGTVEEVVLASGGAFPDALSVAPLAAAEGLPILLSATSGMVGDTAEALAALEPERVLVVGGEAAISREVAARVPGARRLAGAERYATSLEVAEEFLRRGADLGVVYVATGLDFPDALAAGPVAARTGGPVLLVDGEEPSRSPASLAFLRAHGRRVGALWVFGGAAAIGEPTVDRLVQARGEP